MDIITSFRSLLEGYKEARQRYVDQGFSEEEVQKALDLFQKLKIKRKLPGVEGDIDRIRTFQDLLEKIKQAQVVKPRAREIVQVPGSEIVFQNDEWVVFKIWSQEAAIKLGSGTKWCITSLEPADGVDEFDEHPLTHYTNYLLEHQAIFYYLLSKKRSSKDPLYKVAVAVGPRGRFIDVRDSADDDIRNMLNSIHVPTDIFVPRNMEKKEDFLSWLEGVSNFCGFKVVYSGSTVDCRATTEGDIDRTFLDLSRGALKLDTIPIKFGSFEGNFSCAENLFTTLEGWCPDWVDGNFDCSDNPLENLVGSPEHVGGHFTCRAGLYEVKSLKGLTPDIGGRISISQREKDGSFMHPLEVPFTQEEIKKAQSEE